MKDLVLASALFAFGSHQNLAFGISSVQAEHYGEAGESISCEQSHVTVAGGTQCLRATHRESGGFNDYADFMIYQTKGNSGGVSYRVTLTEAPTRAYVGDMSPEALVDNVIESGRAKKDQMASPRLLKETSYVTVTDGSRACVDFFKPGWRQQQGVAYSFYGEFCLQGHTQELSPSEVAALLNSVKSDD